jgi:2-hydroxy-3-oxopropionate reductase
MLPDSPDVEEVALGTSGIFACVRANCIYIDMSTIRPTTARKLARTGEAAGIAVLDAPVSGGDRAAAEASLSVMVGGSVADFERTTPILGALGSTVVYVGPAGSGQTVKAANQLVVAGIIELVAEAIVFLEAHGVDTEAATRVLSGGLAGNQVLTRKGAAMLARQFGPGFRVDLHHKDLGIVLESARHAGVAIPLGAHVAQLMGSLRAQGDGGLDHTALLRLVEQLSGRSS